MALKTSNKNRKKNPLVEAVEDTVTDTAEQTMAAITNLAELNKDITKANTIWTAVGVVVGIAILVLIL